MQPEVQLVVENEGPLKLEDIVTRTGRNRKTIHQNLQTAIKNGLIYSPSRGLYERKEVFKLVLFKEAEKWFRDWSSKLLVDRDSLMGEIGKVVENLRAQADTFAFYAAEMMSGNTPTEPVDIMNEYIFPKPLTSERAAKKKKSFAEYTPQELEAHFNDSFFGKLNVDFSVEWLTLEKLLQCSKDFQRCVWRFGDNMQEDVEEYLKAEERKKK